MAPSAGHTAARARVLAQVADRIQALGDARPRRVAVDGITAAGKTTFADDLAHELRHREVLVVRVSMDGFHQPQAIRYRQGRASADGYYEDAYDLAAIRRVLLDPLGPGGDRTFVTAVYDLASDRPLPGVAQVAPPDAVVVVDGSFLQRPALRPGWDLVVYLDASFAAAADRGVQRDAGRLGGTDAAAAAYRDRYHRAQRRYLAECNPRGIADVVVDHDDPRHPSLVAVRQSLRRDA